MFEIIKINTRYNVQFAGENISPFMLNKRQAVQLKQWLTCSFPSTSKSELLKNYQVIRRYLADLTG